MGVVIDQAKCVGCRRCAEICPGNIIKISGEGKAYLKRPEECWSCTSCMKECPKGAISLILAPEMGGTGARMRAKRDDGLTVWTVYKNDKEITSVITNVLEANGY